MLKVSFISVMTAIDFLTILDFVCAFTIIGIV